MKSPAMQALLKFLEGAIPAAIIAGLLAAVQFLTQPTINWRLALVAVLTVAAVKLLDAGVVYFKAHGQAAAAAVLSAAAAAVPAAPTLAASSAAAPVSNI